MDWIEEMIPFGESFPLEQSSKFSFFFCFGCCVNIYSGEIFTFFGSNYSGKRRENVWDAIVTFYFLLDRLFFQTPAKFSICLF